jgi:hypothetical protein
MIDILHNNIPIDNSCSIHKIISFRFYKLEALLGELIVAEVYKYFWQKDIKSITIGFIFK